MPDGYSNKFRCGYGTKENGLNGVTQKVGITQANLSILKNNKAKAIRFSTLDEICKVLQCQPGDILQFVED